MNDRNVRPELNASRTSSPSLSTATTITPSLSSARPSSPRHLDIQARLNVERNHRTIPHASPSQYPTIPRFSPAVPGRVSGNYTQSNAFSSGSSNSGPIRHPGTSSASSSPPGTPPSGLRSYYLNAAYQRSHHPIFPISSAPCSSTALQRPNFSVLIPPSQNNNNCSHPAQSSQGQNTSRVQIPRPTIARRSYSADLLSTEKLEITVTTPGGTSSTENHVRTLERALSRLVESNEANEDDNNNDNNNNGENEGGEEDGPIMMKGSKVSTAASTLVSTPANSSPPGTPPHRKGVTKFPKVIVGRLSPSERTAEASGSVPSQGADLTPIEMEIEPAFKGKVNKGNIQNRLSKIFHLERTPITLPQPPLSQTLSQSASHSQAQPLGHNLPVSAAVSVQQQITLASDLARQPSKSGVLSNLLKLQGNARHSKVRPIVR
ncbi:hypothetical protein BGW38_004839 [Lunasporangiospora selenospora]|uniref:Uncharacterized protein n=1 Tax=Lunasporangiospora selenospora TaxID=979761 RepID=A0A9P6FP70_9FUNG|nr:hypothetical protein BGW38_004839 [Lunasporangiospora selenospora]